MAHRAKHPRNPPDLAGLAEQVASLIEGLDESEVRSAADSFVPSILPLVRDADDTAPAPFDLVNQRSLPGLSSFFAPAHYVAVLAAFAALALVALAGTRLGFSPQAAPMAQNEPTLRTPAQAASWVTEPFTVDVPVESARGAARIAGVSSPNGTSAALAHFDVEAAASALVGAKNSLSNCEADDDTVPMTARATVTFAPSGNVTSVALDLPEGAEPLPACVGDRLRAARIAPFAGSSVTVRTTVTFPAP
jgi:hypothetical protein